MAETKEAAPQEIFRKAIKVIAVGGGGGNALNHIISHGLKDVDTLAVNTDVRSLGSSLCESKIVLGESVTKGLGAGAMPEVGERAAKESLDEIRRYMKGADMVYLTAGMGGGTGTGAMPVIARAAREMGILTVAVVTKPFTFEGKRRRRYAEEGIEKLFPEVDALIVVPNDRLLEIAQKNTPLTESFSLADEVLRQAVQGVTDLVTRPGLVNVDFADLNTVMRGAGRTVMGVGAASGEDCVEKAVRMALESPLMECSMQGAKGVLMNITHRKELALYEVGLAADIIEDVKSPDAHFIWGCAEDPSIEEEVEVTIVAAGFDEVGAVKCAAAKNAAPERGGHEERARAAEAPEPEAAPAQREHLTPHAEVRTPAWLLEEAPAEEESESEEPYAGRRRSAYDAYERPAFERKGRSLKK
ncbi:cell division protein FtsZ [Cloacibacillus sp. An23]|uniref:cell division protein FtsZ n=1 Tax=Cloacibacillus sp. An23 TaxID=1965591 RepID=UPI000B3AAD58|nr:cell division protein FtsZ [Cloacibacillus sp. An23]